MEGVFMYGWALRWLEAFELHPGHATPIPPSAVLLRQGIQLPALELWELRPPQGKGDDRTSTEHRLW